MKNNNTIPKKSAIILLLFAFSLCYFSCSNEEEFMPLEGNVFNEDQNKGKKIYQVTSSSIPASITNFLYESTNGTSKVNISQKAGITLSKDINKTTSLGTIDESRSVVVAYNGETRYTFLVQPDTDEDSIDEVINLIVVEKEEEIQEYFIKYTFDDSLAYRTAIDDGIDMSQFSGTITYYDETGSITGETTMTNGVESTSSGDGLPCPDDPDDPADDNNNPGGGNNGGGGSGTGGNQPGDGTGTPGGGDDNNGGGGGEIVDPDNCTVITYEACFLNGGSSGPRGAANGHGPACQDDDCSYRCSGSATVITDHCTGNTVRFRGKSGSTTVTADDCDNSVGVIVDGRRKECKKVTDFLDDADNTNFKQRMLELANPANSAQYLDVDFETSLTIHEFHTDVEERQGNPGERFVDITYVRYHSNRVKAWVHTHPNGVGVNGTYSVFSFEDLMAIANMIELGKIDTDNFVAFLITKKGNNYTHYAFTIDSKSKFMDFFYAYRKENFNINTASQIELEKRRAAFDKSDPLRQKYFDNDDARIKQQNVNSEQMLKEFLNFMSEANMGATMFKSDETFSNFTKVSLRNPSAGSSSEIREESCN